MRKLQIIVLVVTFLAIIVGLTNRESLVKPASRGKVIADDKTSTSGLKVEQAAIFSFQQAGDSITVSGRVCVLDENDHPTGKEIPMVPRKFHKNFSFGCDEGGAVVWYKIKKKKAIVHFKKPKK